MLEPSLWSVTVISFAWPFIASSTELSTISQTRWCRPALPTPPMYMPGPLPDRLEALEDLDVFGGVLLGCHGCSSQVAFVNGSRRQAAASRTTSVKAPREMTSWPLPPRPVFL